MTSEHPATQDLQRVGGTAAGGYFRVAPGILLAIPHAGFQQTQQSAMASLAELDRLSLAAGQKQVLMVMVDRVASQSASARRVWSTPREQETRCGLALICDTLLARAIGSFFLGLTKTPVPTRMFASIELARPWAEQMAREHGGPLG